jgi:hypothetical protein
MENLNEGDSKYKHFTLAHRRGKSYAECSVDLFNDRIEMKYTMNKKKTVPISSLKAIYYRSFRWPTMEYVGLKWSLPSGKEKRVLYPHNQKANDAQEFFNCLAQIKPEAILNDHDMAKSTGYRGWIWMMYLAVGMWRFFVAFMVSVFLLFLYIIFLGGH